MPKERNRLVIKTKTNESGTKHRNYGWPNAISTTNTGAAPGAWSRTMSRKLDGNAHHARPPVKKIECTLVRNLHLKGKRRRILPRVRWWVALNIQLGHLLEEAVGLALVAGGLRMYMGTVPMLRARSALLLRRNRIHMPIRFRSQHTCDPESADICCCYREIVERR